MTLIAPMKKFDPTDSVSVGIDFIGTDAANGIGKNRHECDPVPIFGGIPLMVSTCKPSNAKLRLFSKLNCLPSCSHARPNKLHIVNQ